METSFFVPKPPAQGSGRWAEYLERRDAVAQQLAQLGYLETSDIFIASTDNATVVSTKGELALRRIAEGTHRLATEDEIAGFHAAQASRERDYKVIERASKERDGKGASAGEIAEALKTAFGDPSAPARAGRTRPAGDKE